MVKNYMTINVKMHMHGIMEKFLNILPPFLSPALASKGINLTAKENCISLIENLYKFYENPQILYHSCCCVDEVSDDD